MIYLGLVQRQCNGIVVAELDRVGVERAQFLATEGESDPGLFNLENSVDRLSTLVSHYEH
jgi:hypothetical protein